MSAEQGPKPERQKWEYCVVAWEQKGFAGLQRVIYSSDPDSKDNTRKEAIGKPVLATQINLKDDLSIITRLGFEGWELVYATEHQWYYFKRPVLLL